MLLEELADVKKASAGLVHRPTPLDELYERATKALARGEHDEALKLLRKVVATDPNHKAARRKLGMLLADNFNKAHEADYHFKEVERLQQLRKKQSSKLQPGQQELSALQAQANRAKELEWENDVLSEQKAELEKAMLELQFQLTQQRKEARETSDVGGVLFRESLEVTQQEAVELRQSLAQARQEVCILAEQVMASELELQTVKEQLHKKEEQLISSLG
eukprot:TRINITY_DN37991_c0_g1_i1.p1 TRINITY_DN37991_c0_g1~~TRINITY_DN37991_c0_g1_i1.p1  ORF type:complete len:220 (-),score=78.10 TRINITY_DN37991_c0_g1_i1:411-1070(-)